jgi:hypothetical protein
MCIAFELRRNPRNLSQHSPETRVHNTILSIRCPITWSSSTSGCNLHFISVTEERLNTFAIHSRGLSFVCIISLSHRNIENTASKNGRVSNYSCERNSALDLLIISHSCIRHVTHSNAVKRIVYFEENRGCIVCYFYSYKIKIGLCCYCNYQLISYNSLAHLVKIYRGAYFSQLKYARHRVVKLTRASLSLYNIISY